jgi:hypothetical protein
LEQSLASDRLFPDACRLLALVTAAAALGLAALGAILFLSADEPQTSPVLADNAGALNSLLESTEQLIERLGILNLNPHSEESPPVVNHQRQIGAREIGRSRRHPNSIRHGW